jgi:hypothetical protein
MRIGKHARADGLSERSQEPYHEIGGSPMENRIGEFLIEIGAMKKYQVQDVLRVQNEGDQRLFGEIAIELGYVNDDAIARYLESRRTGGPSE